LLGRGIRNAANYPSVDAETYKALEPYINLSEKLGMFSAQLVEGRFQELNITYSGDITKHNLSPLTMALVKGLLSPILQDTVNFINAVALAKERGIKVNESRSSKEAEFSTLIELEIKTDKESRRVSGTLSSNKKPRIVKIDGYYVEASPLGEMIVIQNLDKPGIIGNLGTLLGKQNINIAAMTFGRERLGGKTISVLNVDSPVSAEILDKIKKTENILAVKIIKL